MGNQRKLFGTDGIRGVANIEPLTAETALKIGRAAAHFFKNDKRRHQIVIGKDTRLSGYMLENALVAGVTSMGVDALLIGPLPTPGVAYITRSLRADAGIVLTASHNPYEDNGVKFFRNDGYKLDDTLEAEIEDLVFSGRIDSIRPTAEEVGKAFRIDDALGRYIEFAKSSFNRRLTLEGMRIVVDVANGASYKSSPCVLKELGAEVFVYHNKPDGTNINHECGSMHPEEIQKLVRLHGADVGLAHDGDADRLLLVDEKGSLVDGDELMAIAALEMIRNGRLAHKTLVTTEMSNAGLDEAIQNAGGRVIRTQVGDRYVIEEMMNNDYNLGGEQSGHIIFRDYSTTGDGLVSALQIFQIMKESGKRLSDLRACMRRYPQEIKSVKVKSKPPLESIPGLSDEIEAVKKELAGKGRVFLRYSGTEPKIRLLIEGDQEPKLKEYSRRILSKIEAAIGTKAD
ncbi:phosphoglucosamine mutase [Kamptonema cortianum]|uniref:Phosphoglucosamine mutase n=1 Tax=Geitlerinema calcuttense NRMC-F 0142 TaxID=2922238 RepID=A0ABT7M485_9CYAN|nr:MULTISPECIES: phosphoglucosamine mutase [Cyanophyceae]MDK3161885.1 phosphoglucosamine mutase [Kamptonema cortianum]MDL5050563.1 phosphoglucosamine mutase [Oscillatoria amoena NRMC-F 0135]MDL5055578.1 phosphoglucosamine mutase [Oscillatoria laete-virens NRMC-F 0139]MDL5057856.1 phosphoglucosamine mutase [Geitlerinema calcuttense NRMC-F 0142]